jgi:hypothetical protein
MVMGIIGYTQGVRAVSNPAVSANRNALPIPLPAASAKLLAWAVPRIRKSTAATAIAGIQTGIGFLGFMCLLVIRVMGIFRFRGATRWEM